MAAVSSSRIGPCDTEKPEPLPLSVMVWPREETREIQTGYAGEEGGDEDV